MSPKTIPLLLIGATAALTMGACSSSSKGTPNGVGGQGGKIVSGSGGKGLPDGGADALSSTGSGGNVAGSGGKLAGGGGTLAGGGGTLAGGGGTTGGATGGVSSGGGAGGLAGGKLGTTQCSDGIDNDGDGLIDLQDPECVSPLDNDESSFATGIPGDNKDPCKQDCFFDGNSGMGDDGCEWQLKCDPANIGAGAAASCPYDPSYKNCPTTQSQKCADKCQAITPNGCDCFGCCSVPGVDHAVRLDATCTAGNFGDPTKCPACTQQTSCVKTCDKCQLCLGKTTLDPSCAGPDGGTPMPVCPPDQIVCGTDPNLCPETASCITGCCVPYL